MGRRMHLVTSHLERRVVCNQCILCLNMCGAAFQSNRLYRFIYFIENKLHGSTTGGTDKANIKKCKLAFTKVVTGHVLCCHAAIVRAAACSEMIENSAITTMWSEYGECLFFLKTSKSHLQCSVLLQYFTLIVYYSAQLFKFTPKLL